jgi:hypothetical protein
MESHHAIPCGACFTGPRSLDSTPYVRATPGNAARGGPNNPLDPRIHHTLALDLVVTMVFTVSIRSASHSQIIEPFPSGGG